MPIGRGYFKSAKIQNKIKQIRAKYILMHFKYGKPTNRVNDNSNYNN